MAKKDHKVVNNVFILTTLLFCVFFIITDFSISATLLVVILILSEIGMIVLAKTMTFSIERHFIPYLIIALIILVNLRPNGYIQDQPFYLFSMLNCLFIMNFCKPSDSDRDVVSSILITVAVLVATLVYLSRLMPTLYENTYLSIISSFSREYNHWIMAQGYSGAIGGSIGRTALYITVGEAFSISRYLTNKAKKDLFLSIFLFISLIFVGRRGELLAVSIAVLLTYYGFVSGHKKQRIILLSLAALVILFVGYFLIATNIITYSGNNRILQSVFLLIHGEDVTNGRTLLYAVTWKSIKQHPIFGIGWGGARTIVREILPNDVNVHNIYLQCLCEVGLIGTLFGLIMVMDIFRNRYRIFKTYVGTSKGKYVTAAFFISVFIALFGIFDNPIFQDEFWLLVSILFIMTNRIEEKYE